MSNSVPAHEDQSKVRVFCVESGTCVGRDANGNSLIVTDTMAINIGNTWWLTKPGFDLVRELAMQRTLPRH